MKSNIKWIIIFVLICIVCLAVWLVRQNQTQSAAVAQIKLGNDVIKEIDLSEISEPYEFEITDDNGGHNTVRVERGRICVIDADCPDKICVNQGYISNSAVPIVCLPHKLSITITDKQETIDAVAGGM
jgi:hypothetical protein